MTDRQIGTGWIEQARNAADTDPSFDRQEIISRLRVVRAAKREELFDRLDLARRFLQANVARAVSLSELADVARLSPFHLARHFKAAFLESPIAYHRRLRMEEAAHLIEERDAPLTVVAERLGYSDAAALSHAFRRQFGRSPRSKE